MALTLTALTLSPCALIPTTVAPAPTHISAATAARSCAPVLQQQPSDSRNALEALADARRAEQEAKFEYETFLLKSSKRIEVGQEIPKDISVELVVGACAEEDSCELKTADELLSGTAVLVGMPGAFCAVCNDEHLPGYIRSAPQFRRLGVSTLAVVTTNDRFILTAWKRALAQELTWEGTSSRLQPEGLPRFVPCLPSLLEKPPFQPPRPDIQPPRCNCPGQSPLLCRRPGHAYAHAHARARARAHAHAHITPPYVIACDAMQNAPAGHACALCTHAPSACMCPLHACALCMHVPSACMCLCACPLHARRCRLHRRQSHPPR